MKRKKVLENIFVIVVVVAMVVLGTKHRKKRDQYYDLLSVCKKTIKFRGLRHCERGTACSVVSESEACLQQAGNLYLISIDCLPDFNVFQ